MNGRTKRSGSGSCINLLRRLVFILFKVLQISSCPLSRSSRDRVPFSWRGDVSQSSLRSIESVFWFISDGGLSLAAHQITVFSMIEPFGKQLFSP